MSNFGNSKFALTEEGISGELYDRLERAPDTELDDLALVRWVHPLREAEDGLIELAAPHKADSSSWIPIDGVKDQNHTVHEHSEAAKSRFRR